MEPAILWRLLATWPGGGDVAARHGGPALAGLAGGLVLVWWFARLAGRLRLLDVPGPRSSHASPVPRSGGVGVYAALVLSTVFLLDDGWAPYAVPATLFFAIGLADDRWGLAPRWKFLLQILASALAVLGGLRWEGAGLGPFPDLTFGAATPLLTGLWILAVVSMVNILDGIDYLTAASSVVVLGAAAGGGAGPGEGAMYAAAAGATLGLSFWNASPARVFPGDAGTHLFGFLIASIACGHANDANGTHALPWVLASAPLLPGVVDVAWGIATKRRMGMHWSAAHRHHLYQRLTRHGWSHVAVGLRYAALALLAMLLVGRVAPRHGLVACLGLSALALGAHVGHGVVVARRAARARDAVP